MGTERKKMEEGMARKEERVGEDWVERVNRRRSRGRSGRGGMSCSGRWEPG